MDREGHRFFGSTLYTVVSTGSGRRRDRAASTAAQPSTAFRRPAVDELDAYARAAARLAGLEIDEAWWPGVLRHLAVLCDNAALVEAVDLDGWPWRAGRSVSAASSTRRRRHRPEQVRAGNLLGSRRRRAGARAIAADDGAVNSFTAVVADRALATPGRVDETGRRGRRPRAARRRPVRGQEPLRRRRRGDGRRVEDQRRGSAGARRRRGRQAAVAAPAAVLVGMLNMDEYAYGFTTENAHYGACRNPARPDPGRRRVLRRVGRRRRRRLRPADARLRHQRVGPRPGRPLRRVRPQADLRPDLLPGDAPVLRHARRGRRPGAERPRPGGQLRRCSTATTRPTRSASTARATRHPTSRRASTACASRWPTATSRSGGTPEALEAVADAGRRAWRQPADLASPRGARPGPPRW